jgi:hypothetical protein
MELRKETAKRLFEESPEWFKKEMIQAFGKKCFEKIDFRDIKTFEDACMDQEINPQSVYFGNDTPDEIAYKKLKICVKAINQEWTPDWSNSNQPKWWPYFNLSSGFGFSVSNFGYAYAYSGVGSHLCFESEEKASYAAQQFIDIYKEFLT